MYPFWYIFYFLCIQNRFSLEFILTSFLQVLLIKCFSYCIIVQFLYYTNPRYSVFYFFYAKYLLSPIKQITFGENLFIFWCPNMHYDFQFNVFFTRISNVFDTFFSPYICQLHPHWSIIMISVSYIFDSVNYMASWYLVILFNWTFFFVEVGDILCPHKSPKCMLSCEE